MTTKLFFKTLALTFFMLPALASAHNGKWKGKYTKEKTIRKEFEVYPDALLEVNNSYGNISITSWKENRILIEVHIKTNGNNEEKVAQKLRQISVDFSASKDRVSARTDFNKGDSGWGWNWGRNTNVNMQVNYTIKVPIKGKVDLDNDYGNITLDRIDGHAKINCDYGRLDIGELRGRNNQLNFDYSPNSTIGYINSGKISADYSGFTIEKAIDLVVSADYTNSTINKIDHLEYSSDYGKIEVENAKNITGDGDYINVLLGTLHGNVDIKADYGSLKIKKMAEDAGNLLINANYTAVKIGYDDGYHFNFEIKTSYAGVRGKDPFQIQISEEKNNSAHYQGHYGSANSGNSVSVSSDYGDVSFYQN